MSIDGVVPARIFLDILVGLISVDLDNVLGCHGGEVQGNDVKWNQAGGLILGSHWEEKMVDGWNTTGPDLAENSVLVAVNGPETRWVRRGR